MTFFQLTIRLSLFVLLVMSPVKMVSAESDVVGLPEKSEWLPGVIKRDENGNLYLAEPEVKNKVEVQSEVDIKNKLGKASSPDNRLKPDKAEAQVLYKDWVLLSWDSPDLKTDTHSNITESQSSSSSRNKGKNKSQDILGYYVYYWTTKNNKKIKRDVKQKTEYKIKDLNFGETYFFAVTSYNVRGIESRLSKTKSVKLMPPTPSN